MLAARFKPVPQIGSGRNLLAVDLVGSLQQGVAQSVVTVLFFLNRASIVLSSIPWPVDTPIVGLRGDIVEQAGQVGHGEVVRAGEAGIDRGKAEHGGIEALSGAYDAGINQRIGVSDGGIVGQGIAVPLIVNEAVVGAELQRVMRMRPGQIIDQILHWHIDDGGAGLGIEGAHAIEIRIRSLTDSVGSVALANIAVTQAVHQGRGDGGVEAGGDAFAVAGIAGAGSLAGKLRRTQRAVFLQIAAQEQPVPAGQR